MNNAGFRRTGGSGRRGARALPAAVLVVAAAAATTGTSAGAEPTQLLPDLVADPIARPYTAIYSDSSGTRWLLRFDGFVHNRGVGPVEVRGSSPVEREQTVVRQRIYDSSGGYQDISSADLRLLFEPEDGHDHWHLPRAAEYSLHGPAGEVAAQKVGFCLIDSQHVDSWGPGTAVYTMANNRFCEQRSPTADSVTMGVSAGWRDLYSRNLAFQWVDISDVQPGSYQVESDADPGNVIVESDENNKPTFVGVTVPGYVAKDFTKQVSRWLSSPIALPANAYGQTGTKEFRIDADPQYGSLNRKADGGWFSASSVMYTPKLGNTWPDSFRFSVRDVNNKDFPRTRYSATATLTFGGLLLSSVAGPTSTAVADAEPRPAPDVSQPLPTPDGRPIAAPQVELRHGDLIVRTVPWRSGAVRLRMTRADGTVAGCSANVPAGEPFTCRLARGIDPAQMQGGRVVAELRVGGRVVGSRSTPTGR